MRKLLGVVGVDSGMLMVTDPCYVPGFKNDDPLEGEIRYFVDSEGRKFAYPYHSTPENRAKYDIEAFEGDYQTVQPNGKTPNEMIASGEWIEAKIGATQEYSYSGCCSVTNKDDRGGQLLYQLGHEGAGVAFRTRYGDGCYPVFAEYDDEGRTLRVTIDFSEDNG